MYLPDKLPMQKVLMVVKTYPNLSRKYGELVCTAGITPEGKWIRIYPIKFRDLKQYQKFPKYSWIEIDLVRNHSDFRVESYSPVRQDSEIKIIDKIDTSNNWLLRKRMIDKVGICNEFETLIKKAKNHKYSLGIIRPKLIEDFYFEKEKSIQWSPEQLAYYQQPQFFKDIPKTPNLRKLPYKFKYRFTTEDGEIRNLMIEDWEIGQLFWNCLDKYGSEEIALKKVKERYFDDFVTKKDLLFFVGTTKSNHFVSRNPFIIIGAFYPKKTEQLSLFDTV